MGLAQLGRLTKAWLGALVALGLGIRVAPLFDQGGRLLAQWPTEDGYFMLTMGRNIALGHGLSVAGGETPTNGTQPLTTLLWALCYLIAGPERSAGVLVALLFEIAAATATAFLLYRLGRAVLADRADSALVSALAAALWFASPVAIPHTMNCLESGMATLASVAIALAFVTGGEPLWSWRRTIAFGVLLGIGFWVRNDLSFLIFAACVVYLAPALTRSEERAPRLARVLAFGATSVLVASPWLIFNYTRFGHVMPVSGRAEVLTGTFGGNLKHLPIVLAEYIGTVLPIPHRLSEHPVVIAGATGLVIGAIVLSVRAYPRLAPPTKQLVRLVAIQGALLSAFYGLYFGAGWFLGRYFLPISGALALFFVTAVFAVRARLAERTRRVAEIGAALMVTLVFALLGVREYRGGAEHEHFQVVRWVEENVPEDTWVGAIQTGTLGFFHDRTVNLDGKVNLAAYEALVAGAEGRYVVEDTEIQYLADWVGMRDWMDKPEIAASFEVVVYDEAANLAVLRRRAR